MDQSVDSGSDILEDNGIISYTLRKTSLPEDLKRNLVSILGKTPSKIIFDFENIEELDSLELSLLVMFEKDIRKNNADIELVLENLQMDVMRLFILSGLDQQFSISF